MDDKPCIHKYHKCMVDSSGYMHHMYRDNGSRIRSVSTRTLDQLQLQVQLRLLSWQYERLHHCWRSRCMVCKQGHVRNSRHSRDECRRRDGHRWPQVLFSPQPLLQLLVLRLLPLLWLRLELHNNMDNVLSHIHILIHIHIHGIQHILIHRNNSMDQLRLQALLLQQQKERELRAKINQTVFVIWRKRCRVNFFKIIFTIWVHDLLFKILTNFMMRDAVDFQAVWRARTELQWGL